MVCPPLRDEGRKQMQGQWPWSLQCRRRRWLESGASPSYVLCAWLRLWGWSCCRFCCSCTASCWHWSDVESLFINGETQFAGMIRPAKHTQACERHNDADKLILYVAASQHTDDPLAVFRSEPDDLHLHVGSADGSEHLLQLVPHAEHWATQNVVRSTSETNLAR